MKKISAPVNKTARRVFVLGWIAVALIVAASTVLYIGAGDFLDYYSAVDASEILLAFSRPAGVSVCVSSLLIEYCSSKK